MLVPRELTQNEVRHYTPQSRSRLSTIEVTQLFITNLWRFRELIFAMFSRDFRAAYKKSFLGILWFFVSPFLGIISWIFLERTGMLRPGDVGVPYAAYVLIGSSFWSLFLGFYNSSSTIISSSSHMIMQVKFPREVIFAKLMLESMSNFLISFLVNILVLFLMGVIPSWKTIFILPLMLPLLFLGAAIGFMVSLIGVVVGDLPRIVSILLGLLMYVTPVIYGDHVINPYLKKAIDYNPLTYLVCSLRDIILFGRLYSPERFWICAGASVLCFIFCWRFFFLSEEIIIEKSL
jgi:ABC-type polysaccharide/polyol phosphate export permease